MVALSERHFVQISAILRGGNLARFPSNGGQKSRFELFPGRLPLDPGPSTLDSLGGRSMIDCAVSMPAQPVTTFRKSLSNSIK
jgi:hypothetical protein